MSNPFKSKAILTLMSVFVCSDGPYGVFAGRDASRALALFDLSEKCLPNEYDDLSDLGPSEMEDVKNWADNFTRKPEFIVCCGLKVAARQHLGTTKLFLKL